MPTHKSSDYKLSAVKFFLSHSKNQAQTCKTFGCSERSLMRGVNKINMFTWLMSLFRKNKVAANEKDDEPSIHIKPPCITCDNDYDDIISKLSLDETFFTKKDVTYMHTLTNAQLVYLILLKQ